MAGFVLLQGIAHIALQLIEFIHNKAAVIVPAAAPHLALVIVISTRGNIQTDRNHVLDSLGGRPRSDCQIGPLTVLRLNQPQLIVSRQLLPADQSPLLRLLDIHNDFRPIVIISFLKETIDEVLRELIKRHLRTQQRIRNHDTRKLNLLCNRLLHFDLFPA